MLVSQQGQYSLVTTKLFCYMVVTTM